MFWSCSSSAKAGDRFATRAPDNGERDCSVISSRGESGAVSSAIFATISRPARMMPNLALPASGLVEPMDALLGFVHGVRRPQDQRAEAPLGAELARECSLLEEEPRHLRIGDRRTVVCMNAVEDHPCRGQSCIGRAEQKRGASTQILTRRQQ